MNDNAKKWVAALRSGKFEQGVGKLLSNGKYCCLGVACRLYQNEVGNLSEWNDEEYGVTSFDEDEGELPVAVINWLGLRHPDGMFGVSPSSTLVDINDSGTPFTEIADLIESEPEGLFCE